MTLTRTTSGRPTSLPIVPPPMVVLRESQLSSALTTIRQQRSTLHNEEKSKFIYETFFPRSQNRTQTDASTDYPDPVCAFRPITDDQIHWAISRLAPYKAPGPNGISNIVFKNCSDLLVPWMGHFFRATFELKFLPNEWLNSKTVVIRKPGRPDYSAPKAYRPIALLDTMSKILSACVAEDLTWITTKHNLLPHTHFGGLPGRSTTDSLHLLTKFIHDAWAHPTNNHVSMMFMDIKAAFPSVVPEQLFHNMRKRGILTEYIDWYKTRLTRWSTTLEFNDYCSPAFQIETGVNQGCPLAASVSLLQCRCSRHPKQQQKHPGVRLH